MEEAPKLAWLEAGGALVGMTRTTICIGGCDAFGNAGRKYALKFILANE